MTTRPNMIQMPDNLRIRISITIDPNTNQSEMKIERGKITNLQLATALMQHATHINQQLVAAEARIVGNPFGATPPAAPPTGDTDNAS